MAPRDLKDGVGGGGGPLDPEADIETPLISSGSSFFRDAVYGDDDDDDGEGDEEQRRRRRRFLLGGRSHSNTTSQVALVGADVCPIESLDYELIENDVFKQDWRARGRGHILRYVALKWALCFLVGALAAAVAFVANLGVENVAGAKFVVTSNLMLDGKHGSAFAVFLASNFALTILAAALTVFVAPAAAGSGIPEVKAYLNGVDAPNIFSLKTLMVKCHHHYMWEKRVHWDRRDLVTCGAAAGIAAAFRAPVGGVLFALETVSSWKGKMYKLLLAATVTTCTSCCLFGLPWIASCKPCPSGTEEACPSIGRSGNFKKFQCAMDEYNDLASLFFNTNDDTIRNLYSAGTDDEFHFSSMLVFFGASYFLGIFSYGLALPSGLFVPVILTGAAYGRLVGMLIGSQSTLDHGLFAVLGSAALLGGSMRMTVSVCVIMLELTNNLLLLPLVMLVLLISKLVADAFNANVYDLLVRLKGFPHLEGYAEPYMRQLSVSDIVTGPLQTFSGIEKVGNIVHVLKTTGHSGFPVIDEPPFSDSPLLYGLILRAHLLVLLRKKEFIPGCTTSTLDASKYFSPDDFAKPGSGKRDRIEDIELTAEELEMFVDLHPFTNTSPYTVLETMSLAKALILFRELGLRHLLVLPKCSKRAPVVGILTRHDFMPEHILGLHPFLFKSRWRKVRLAGLEACLRATSFASGNGRRLSGSPRCTTTTRSPSSGARASMQQKSISAGWINRVEHSRYPAPSNPRSAAEAPPGSSFTSRACSASFCLPNLNRNLPLIDKVGHLRLRENSLHSPLKQI
ncbi:hypothetical protein PR202_ga18822 [Eleusine coracana subsp. coracana]|uniref:CBS domain-containing protein n=1 Tax=Eleusine coracana subsp. coracana TaxID=191504 RepID=A0AAV5CTX0_ELECO|nr:hypothetical protein PR202_ga18822 [Eleusine coracana subsp. coracana]